MGTPLHVSILLLHLFLSISITLSSHLVDTLKSYTYISLHLTSPHQSRPILQSIKKDPPKMSGEIEIVAIFKSNPGKADRAQQVLDEMAAYIKANEPGTLRYHLSRETKGDAPTFVLLETYKDKKSLQEHGSSARFKEFNRTLGKEKLFESFKVVYTKGVAGFSSRL